MEVFVKEKELIINNFSSAFQKSLTGESMTVKDLIQQLKKWDPDAEVRIGRGCGPVDWGIKGISVYFLSPTDNQYCVYLGCENKHYQREKIQQTIPVENTFMTNIPTYNYSNYENE